MEDDGQNDEGFELPSNKEFERYGPMTDIKNRSQSNFIKGGVNKLN